MQIVLGFGISPEEYSAKRGLFLSSNRVLHLSDAPKACSKTWIQFSSVCDKVILSLLIMTFSQMDFTLTPMKNRNPSIFG